MELSLFLEGLDHGQPHLQELRPQRRRRRLLQFVRRRESWPSPSTPTSAAGARELPPGSTDTSTSTRTHGRQHIRSTAPVPVSPGTSVTWCNDYEEDRRLLDLRPHLLGVAAQGAQLLLREVPRATSPLGLQEARSLDLGRNTRWHGVGQPPMSALESISKSAPGSIFRSPFSGLPWRGPGTESACR